ncbi:Uncharacterised protein [Mycobacteroides abscessus subsp. abscessus]|nr:Uncharacterised protein [Mycobacteroides abscessus subsp. abscessus]
MCASLLALGGFRTPTSALETPDERHTIDTQRERVLIWAGPNTNRYGTYLDRMELWICRHRPMFFTREARHRPTHTSYRT